VGDKPTPNPTEGDKLTTKLNQNYLLVGDKPTAKPTEGDKLTTKAIYLWEINLHLPQQREINLQPKLSTCWR